MRSYAAFPAQEDMEGHAARIQDCQTSLRGLVTSEDCFYTCRALADARH